MDRYKCILGSVGISWIGAIELYALYQGHNGVLLSGTLAVIAGIIAGLAGYEIGIKKK